ncbi:MAG: single-stranded-DNA-specific exonuclease RecJ [Cellulosilyticaceae bacterium]
MLPSKYKWNSKNNGTKAHIIEQILDNRGIDGAEARYKFLHPSQTQLYNPYLLSDMERAVERIRRVKQEGKEIVIYGDYDVDGVTSTSILYIFLKSLGYEVSYYIPNRQTEGYGLNKEALKKIEEYANLVITVDTGIAAIDEVSYAKEIGLDIIITDHHECQEELPAAYCVINPKRPGSTYPFDALAGVGVTFKLIHALAIREDVEDQIWQYLDIVALGTVADVVPLEDENRVITYLGFMQMGKTVHVGLKALLGLLQTKDNKITSNLIGYQLGPRINAAGRISDAKLGVELLVTRDLEKAKKIALLLDAENKKRQEMEAQIVEEAQRYIDENIDVEKEKIIIVAGKKWHHGVIGIVASRIMGQYYKPTIILTLEDGVYSGSARSIAGFNIFEAINHNRDKLIRFGGHEMAAGLSLDEKMLEIFISDISSYTEEHLAEELLTPCLDIDTEIEANELTLSLCNELEQLEPFGSANPSPTFAISGEIQYIQQIGQDNKHLKLSIQKGQNVFQGVGFGKGYLAEYLSEGEEVIIAGEIVKNEWNGRTTVQIRIKDIQSPAEKVMESKYYLSLYNYMKEPEIIKRSEVNIHKMASTTDRVNVFTENGLKEIYKIYKNQQKPITNLNEICYNEWYGLKEEPIIYVNSLLDNQFNENTNYEWDFKTKIDYTCINPSLNNHIMQVPKMVPSYVDCKVIYKFLKNNKQNYIYIHKAVSSLDTCNMTEYKLLQALDVFEELGLICYKLIDDKITYEMKLSSKTNLEHSKRYMHLQKFAGCMCN